MQFQLVNSMMWGDMSFEIIYDLAHPSSANYCFVVTFHLLNFCFSCLSMRNKALPESVLFWGKTYFYFVCV